MWIVTILLENGLEKQQGRSNTGLLLEFSFTLINFFKVFKLKLLLYRLLELRRLTFLEIGNSCV